MFHTEREGRTIETSYDSNAALGILEHDTITVRRPATGWALAHGRNWQDLVNEACGNRGFMRDSFGRGSRGRAHGRYRVRKSAAIRYC